MNSVKTPAVCCLNNGAPVPDRTSEAGSQGAQRRMLRLSGIIDFVLPLFVHLISSRRFLHRKNPAAQAQSLTCKTVSP
ncbi:MAG: hypothetical protein ACXWPS_13990 [Ktedonobacteraceae bacterium]